MGDNIIVMNCIWVLKKAEGHNFGKLLMEDMIKSEKEAAGFATIALENHWSPWFKKGEMEKLGFKSLDSTKVAHKTKYKGQVFSIHLMWMPTTEKAKPLTWNKKKVFSIHLMWMPTTEKAKPLTWNKKKLLEGITTCILHPLYHPQTYRSKQILEKR
jgi:hypothetical protein